MTAAQRSSMTRAPTRTILIEPSRRWSRGFHELWEYRELFFFFVWRDLKVRYKQTFLGATWAILQPLVLVGVFSISVGKLSGVSPTSIPYPVFALAGLVVWTLFSSALQGSSQSLVENSNLVSKVYFPRILMPVAAGATFLIDFVLAMVVLVGMMTYYGVGLSLSSLWSVPLALLTLVAALGVGIYLAGLNVRYRDVRYAVPFLIQVGLFISPIAYSTSVIPARWRALYGLNPMAGIIEGFRAALLGTSFPTALAAEGTGVAFLALLLGILYFHRVERAFADVI